jgi:hypothetical protein
MIENLIIIAIGGIGALAILIVFELIAKWKGWE